MSCFVIFHTHNISKKRKQITIDWSQTLKPKNIVETFEMCEEDRNQFNRMQDLLNLEAVQLFGANVRLVFRCHDDGCYYTVNRANISERWEHAKQHLLRRPSPYKCETCILRCPRSTIVQIKHARSISCQWSAIRHSIIHHQEVMFKCVPCG